MTRKGFGLALTAMALALIVYGTWSSGRGYLGSGMMAVGLALFLILAAVITLRSSRPGV